MPIRRHSEARILFTCVGRRVELVQAFRKAAVELGTNLTIFGADITDTAPALYFCDEIRMVCRIDDKNYIPQLMEICGTDEIDCLIPTIDTDLMLLAENKRRFEEIGTKVLIGSAEKIKICRDKNYTADYFISLGLKSPLPINSVEKFKLDLENGKAMFPVSIKPKDGSSSIDAFRVDGLDELKVFADKIGDYVIQPYISGREYTVDIFCDYEGNPIYITPRERLAVREGEVLKTRITQDDSIIKEMERLVSDFKPSGQITVQLIINDLTGDHNYIEINPRFGGGAPLSMKAGADSAKALIRILNGERLNYVKKAAKDGAVYSRFDQSICVNSKKVEQPCQAVIFDLDDTLFSEKEYVRSGYHAVASILPQIDDVEEKLWDAFQSGKPAIDAVLKDEGIYTEELAEECLNTYRDHIPDIHLYYGVLELFGELRKRGIKIGIITDGRPEGQRNKIKVLGLEDKVDEIIVTDEIGGPEFRKPDDISFRIMQKRLDIPFETMVYVGDNIAKDFIAPEKLGMKFVWFKNNDGIYFFTQQNKGIKIVTSLKEILKFVCGGGYKLESYIFLHRCFATFIDATLPERSVA